jgi:hypothetical protein
MEDELVYPLKQAAKLRKLALELLASASGLAGLDLLLDVGKDMHMREEATNSASELRYQEPFQKVDTATDYVARALFINGDGTVYLDYLICSGRVDSILGGMPCPCSSNGRIPDLVPLLVVW